VLWQETWLAWVVGPDGEVSGDDDDDGNIYHGEGTDNFDVTG
jgi:hypothetical protein